MLYLFSFAGKIGYVQNTLETLSLPYGAENVYEYTLPENELHSEKYVAKNAREFTPDEHVLILLIDKDQKRSEFQYIPLRKAKLLRIEIEQDRIYYTVALLEHCTPTKGKADEDFQRLLLKAFPNQLLRRKGKGINGFLAFRGEEYSFIMLDSISKTDTPWLTAVKRLSSMRVFKEYKCIFTMLTVHKQGSDVPIYGVIGRRRKATYKFSYGAPYCAELDYYIPFYNNAKGTVISVQFLSSPHSESLSGALLVQRCNLNQGKLKFNFVASAVHDFGELAFQIVAQPSAEKTIDIMMTAKGVSYYIKRSAKRNLLIGAVGIFGVALSGASLILNREAGKSVEVGNSMIKAGVTLLISYTSGFLAILWNGKKR